jgi:hypothetical protein
MGNIVMLKPRSLRIRTLAAAWGHATGLHLGHGA